MPNEGIAKVKGAERQQRHVIARGVQSSRMLQDGHTTPGMMDDHTAQLLPVASCEVAAVYERCEVLDQCRVELNARKSQHSLFGSKVLSDLLKVKNMGQWLIIRLNLPYPWQ